METNKRQHFISLFILSLLLSCSGEKKDSAQTETVSNKAIVRIETVSAQDVEQISEFTATVEANISNNRETVCRSRRSCKSRSTLGQDG